MNPLAGFSVTLEIPVAWGDMDAFGHVNNVAFFRYFESARVAYLVRIEFAEGPRTGVVGPILHSTHCRFRRALVYPDTVTVGARTIELKEDRFVMEYRLVSRALGAVAAEGGGVVVAIDYATGAKASIPQNVRKNIESLDAAAMHESGHELRVRE